MLFVLIFFFPAYPQLMLAIHMTFLDAVLNSSIAVVLDQGCKFFSKEIMPFPSTSSLDASLNVKTDLVSSWPS